MHTSYYSIIHLSSVGNAVKEMQGLFPPDQKNPIQDFGSNGSGEFFSGNHTALNKIAVHPELLAKVRFILKTDQIRLVQSIPWAKYGVPTDGPNSNNDQRMHMDYGNNMYGMPLPNEPLQAVAAIVYYSNTEETGGATAIVPRISDTDPVYKWPYVHMPGIGGYPFVNDRNMAETIMDSASKKIRDQCYSREILPTFHLGDVLLYRLDTWHRGTPVKSGKVRYTHNLLWKRADNTDIQVWNRGITRAMYSGKLERFMGSLEPEQLETLGFPLRNSKKWQSSKFCKAMRNRFYYAGFRPINYVQTPYEPPSVPDFWPFSKYTINGLDANALRSSLFSKLREENVHITLKNSLWKYKLEYIYGPHYIVIDCYFFKNDNGYTVDVNLLSGDRWTFGDLWRILSDQVQKRPLRPNLCIQKTPEFVLQRLKNIDIQLDVDLVPYICPEVADEYILPFLKSDDLNIVRMAMDKLKGNVFDDWFHFWRLKVPRTFMESVINTKAIELWKTKSRL